MTKEELQEKIKGMSTEDIVLMLLSALDRQNDEVERLQDALKRIASGWPKPMQLARETLGEMK